MSKEIEVRKWEMQKPCCVLVLLLYVPMQGVFGVLGGVRIDRVVGIICGPAQIGIVTGLSVAAIPVPMATSIVVIVLSIPTPTTDRRLGRWTTTIEFRIRGCR